MWNLFLYTMKWWGAIILLFTACTQQEPVEVKMEEHVPEVIINEDSLCRAQLDSMVALKMNFIGLVNVQELNDQIHVDLRYATDNNFMHQQLYDTLHCVYLQSEVAIRLSAVQHFLDSLRPGYHLLIYDGVRPVQVQQEMWDALDSVPVLNRGKFVSNPKLGSVHNFGAAVDLTIIDQQGIPLDMGANYDDFRPIAFPSLEAHYLKSGDLTREQYENRKLLRKVMKSQKFSNIPSEWWHFNAWSRVTASHKFQQLLTESGDARWFKVELPDSTDSIGKI